MLSANYTTTFGVSDLAERREEALEDVEVLRERDVGGWNDGNHLAFEPIQRTFQAITERSRQTYESRDFWRTLITFLYLTGWRIGEAMSPTWSDVDMEAGTAITRINKAKREERIALHPVVLDHASVIECY